jgi:hypothetical protein
MPKFSPLTVANAPEKLAYSMIVNVSPSCALAA